MKGIEMVKCQAKQSIPKDVSWVGWISLCFFVLVMQTQIKVSMDKYTYQHNVDSRKCSTYEILKIHMESNI